MRELLAIITPDEREVLERYRKADPESEDWALHGPREISLARSVIPKLTEEVPDLPSDLKNNTSLALFHMVALRRHGRSKAR
jgi:hypothetical protein